MSDYEYNKKLKIIFIFLAIFILTFLLILTFIGIYRADTSKINLVKSNKDYSQRGDIYTYDGFTLATSHTVYRAKVYKKYLNPQKVELLLDLLSKYTSIDKEVLRDRLQEDSRSVVLVDNIDEVEKKDLDYLAKILNRERVFRSLKRGGFYRGLDIEKKKDIRKYPLKDTLEPYLGFTRYNDKRLVGKYGLESYYDNFLKNTQDEVLKGEKDRDGVIIRDNKQIVVKKENGFSIKTNIYIELQKRVEQILSSQKRVLGAKEIVAAIMDSKSGKIISIASSRRYNPEKILDVAKTNISAIRYIYEPGSVMKPIFFTLLLEDNKVKIDEIVNTHNGIIRLSNGKRVRDEHKYPFLSAEDVIVHSSNVGMTELSSRANPLHIVDGLRRFGFAQISGIDLSYEHSGTIPSVVDLKNSIIMANISYGYAIRVNFIQLLKAYNIFNNNGKMVTPRIAHIKITSKNKEEPIETIRVKKVLEPYIAHTMQNILRQVVKRGTGQDTIIDGIDIGGKTGTAQIAQRGKYVSRYNSSFFGFANDKKNRFTIGVLVIEPKYTKHFASQSAVPTFRLIVEELINERFLKPKR